ncbi:hypothetical protein Sste5346_007693 [Sporothrix stenoceras]|uniref:Sulfatase N-terminal domain-containing protein n=1 Tax=Sporothrix stenoceras TaxID=5173 RepID=A0ABR3YSW0_9PEZI
MKADSLHAGAALLAGLAAAKQPNILFILADDVHAPVAPHGDVHFPSGHGEDSFQSARATRYGYGAASHAAPNNTYKGLRVIGDTYNLDYSVWCTNETELYNLVKDPYEVRNLQDANGRHATQANALRIAGHSLDQIMSRLDALLVVLKTFVREMCREPRRALHPQGDVTSLHDSLAPHFDAFYASKPRVHFTKCELGYIAESEGPNYVNQFGGGIHHGYIPSNAKAVPRSDAAASGYDCKAVTDLGPQHRISMWT